MTNFTNPTSFLGIAIPGFALAGGSWVILGFCAFLFVGVVVGYYTERGSGITARPYGKVYGGAPGAVGRGEVSGRDPRARMDWSRGTR